MAAWKTASASVGAIVSAILTLGCCLPLPFIGAAGIASASVALGWARPWLLGLSVILVGLGFFQVYRGARCRTKQSKVAIVLLCVSTCIVILVFLFPQLVAGWIADLSIRGQR